MRSTRRHVTTSRQVARYGEEKSPCKRKIVAVNINDISGGKRRTSDRMLPCTGDSKLLFFFLFFFFFLPSSVHCCAPGSWIHSHTSPAKLLIHTPPPPPGNLGDMGLNPRPRRDNQPLQYIPPYQTHPRRSHHDNGSDHPGPFGRLMVLVPVRAGQRGRPRKGWERAQCLRQLYSLVSRSSALAVRPEPCVMRQDRNFPWLTHPLVAHSTQSISQWVGLTSAAEALDFPSLLHIIYIVYSCNQQRTLIFDLQRATWVWLFFYMH